MDLQPQAQPPTYAEATGTSIPIIITFYKFAYVRPFSQKGRRIGRLLSKRKDVVLLHPYTSSLDFAMPLLHRAGDLFGWAEVDRVAFTMLLRTTGRKDIIVDEANWEAICGLLMSEGGIGARLVVAVGPVVEVSRVQKFGGLFLEAKRKVLGWCLPGNLA